MAAVLAAGPGAVLSHRSAAALWGVRQTSRSGVEVTARRRVRKRRGIESHRGNLPTDEVTLADGLPVTTVSRTLLDLASVLPREEVKRAVHEAEIRHLRAVSSGCPARARYVASRCVPRPRIARRSRDRIDGHARRRSSRIGWSQSSRLRALRAPCEPPEWRSVARSGLSVARRAAHGGGRRHAFVERDRARDRARRRLAGRPGSPGGSCMTTRLRSARTCGALLRPPLWTAAPRPPPAVVGSRRGCQGLHIPDERLEGLPGYPFEARYSEIDGLRTRHAPLGDLLPRRADLVLSVAQGDPAGPRRRSSLHRARLRGVRPLRQAHEIVVRPAARHRRGAARGPRRPRRRS